MKLCLTLGLLVSTLTTLAAPAWAAPDARKVLEDLGFPVHIKEKILAGEFIETTLEGTSERELVLALAFLVEVEPKRLVAEFLSQEKMIAVDENVLAQGNFHGEGSLEDLASLPVGEEQIEAFLNAEPGGDVQLSTEEFAVFAGLRESKAAPNAVAEAIRGMLLGRFRAYKESGLDGIAPYDLGDGELRSGGDELEKISAQALSKEHSPAFYAVMNGYPKSRPEGLEERFEWSAIKAHGAPVLVLSHRLALLDGDVYVVAQRQYYVSGGYNVEQASAGLFPVAQGTLVVYLNRTSTDQVAGFGGSGKRAIGRKLMGSRLKAVFDEFRAEAAK